MYIKKRHQQLLNLCDKKTLLPKAMQRFIKQKERPHNLIIKSKGNHLLCTCCEHSFVAQAKINSEIKCPNCKQRLLVKSNRLKQYVFRDLVQYLDKIEDTLILRTYQIYSYYDSNKMDHILTEFMRTIIEDDKSTDYITNQFYNFLGYLSINPWVEFTHWHKSSSLYNCLGITAMVCPSNIKSILKGTELKYSGLEKLIARSDYIFFLDYYRMAHNPSFEILIKMKLFALSLDSAKFYKGNSFQAVFGVPKSFYPFMKKYNLNYKQLEVLRLIQKEDINLINNLININDLEELSKYVNIEEAYYKVLSVEKNTEFEYLDYLKIAKKLQYPMDNKRILYPRNLKKAHNKVTKLYKVVKNELLDKQIQERLQELNKKSYKNNKYIVFPAPSVESLILESKQQNHCVKDYCEDYGLGKKDLYFMRELNNQDKSLVTIEVRNNKIIQARVYDNELPNEEQWKFLNRWQAKILNKASLLETRYQ